MRRDVFSGWLGLVLPWVLGVGGVGWELVRIVGWVFGRRFEGWKRLQMQRLLGLRTGVVVAVVRRRFGGFGGYDGWLREEVRVILLGSGCFWKKLEMFVLKMIRNLPIAAGINHFFIFVLFV